MVTIDLFIVFQRNILYNNPNQAWGVKLPKTVYIMLVLLAIVDPHDNQTILSRTLLPTGQNPVRLQEHPFD